MYFYLGALVSLWLSEYHQSFFFDLTGGFLAGGWTETRHLSTIPSEAKRKRGNLLLIAQSNKYHP